MKVRLTATWELTDEHSASSKGQPVLVCRRTGEKFGPGDIMEPYANWGLKPAAVHAAQISSMKKLSDEEKEFVQRFKLPG